MENTLQLIKQEFESSCSRTPQYLAFHRVFKREFTRFLQNIGAVDVKFSKPNHFDASGFFQMRGQCWYFRLEDLRWSKDSLLVRTAKDYRDYTGGHNRFITFNENFETNLKKVVDTQY